MTSTFFPQVFWPEQEYKTVGKAPEILSRHTILVSRASKLSLEYVFKSPDVAKK